MTKDEVKQLLISRKWEYAPIAYMFNAISFYTNSGVRSQYDIEIEGEKIYLTGTGLRNSQRLLMTINETKNRIVVSGYHS